MNECLVIKLKESSTANNLIRLGALKLNIGLKESRTVVLQLYSHTEQIIRVNSGYFSGTTSQEYIAPAGWINTSIEASSGITEIEFSNKFGISRLDSMLAVDTNNFEIYVDFEDFKYCSSLESIFFSLGKGGGNLESLKNLPIKNIFLDPNDNKLIVEGDISHVLGQPIFESFVIKNQSLVTGNLSAFSEKNVAFTFDLSGTSVTGNIDNLSGVSTNQLLLKGVKKFIGGDIGTLHNGVRFFSVTGSQNNVFTFSSFNSRTDFLAIEGAFLKSGVNNLIIASKNLNFSSTGSEPYEKAINVWANDFFKDSNVSNAISILNSHGIKVIVNGNTILP